MSDADKALKMLILVARWKEETAEHERLREALKIGLRASSPPKPDSGVHA